MTITETVTTLGSAMAIAIGNGKGVNGGQTVWTTAKYPEQGWQLRRWTVAAAYDETQVSLTPQAGGGGMISLAPASCFATPEEARDHRATLLEAELAQVRGLAAG